MQVIQNVLSDLWGANSEKNHDFCLEEALNDLLLKKLGDLDVSIDFNFKTETVDPVLGHHIYQIAQLVLHAVRDFDCRHLEVSLEQVGGDHMILDILADKMILKMSESNNDERLQEIRNRANMIQGLLVMHSRKNKGTRFVLKAPLEKEARGQLIPAKPEVSNYNE